MSFHKLILHDWRSGLLRWRYLAIPVVAVVSCLGYLTRVSSFGNPGSWMDIMFYIFMGQEPIDISSLSSIIQFPVPVVWLLTTGGCLFLNLDYYLWDLSLTGQQIIIRCGSKRKWYFSKCIWNLTSSLLYILLIGITALIFILLLGGKISFILTSNLVRDMLYLSEAPQITVFHGILVTLVAPLLTVMALNMLQMTLCVFTKPIVGFLASIGVLVLSVYIPSGLLLGNGAMTIRNSMVVESGVSCLLSIGVSLTVLFLCIIIGGRYFSSVDILPHEEA